MWFVLEMSAQITGLTEVCLRLIHQFLAIPTEYQYLYSALLTARFPRRSCCLRPVDSDTLAIKSCLDPV